MTLSPYGKGIVVGAAAAALLAIVQMNMQEPLVIEIIVGALIFQGVVYIGNRVAGEKIS